MLSSIAGLQHTSIIVTIYQADCTHPQEGNTIPLPLLNWQVSWTSLHAESIFLQPRDLILLARRNCFASVVRDKLALTVVGQIHRNNPFLLTFCLSLPPT
jgi:hypothetical protein